MPPAGWIKSDDTTLKYSTTTKLAASNKATSAIDCLMAALQPSIPGQEGRAPSCPLTLNEVERLGQTAANEVLHLSAEKLDYAVESLMDLVDTCISIAVELDQNDDVLPLVLGYTKSLIQGLSMILKEVDGSNNLSYVDISLRLQDAVLLSAKLAEREYTNVSVGDSQEHGVSRLLKLWLWDITEPLYKENSGFTAQNLVRQAAETMALSLAAGWRCQMASIQGAFIPIAASAAEQQVLLLVLGRFIAIMNGDSQIGELVLPFLINLFTVPQSIASQFPHSPTAEPAAIARRAELFGLAAHVLAGVAAVFSMNDHRQGYTRVVDMLVKLYKYPQLEISSVLLHGKSSSEPASNRILGQCCGALAAALRLLALKVDRKDRKYSADLKQRLLSLFSDFAAVLPNQTYLQDLGALLPAIGAIVDDVQIHDSSQDGQACSILQSQDSNQENDARLRMLFRQLWLHTAAFDFGNIVHIRWPEEWRWCLGSIAVGTPLLLVGSEEQKLEAFLGRLHVEYMGRLALLGHSAKETQLIAVLSQALKRPEITCTMPLQLLAHTLTISYKAICHARFAAISRCCLVEKNPISGPLAHLALCVPTSANYTCILALVNVVFSIFTSRLGAFDNGGNTRQVIAEQIVEILAKGLTGEQQSFEVGDELLKRLFDSFPALKYKKDVHMSFIAAVAADQQILVGSTGADKNGRLLKSWVLKLTSQAAALAPNYTEAMLLYCMHQMSTCMDSSTVDINQFAPQVFQTARTARASFYYGGPGKNVMGILAWGKKEALFGQVKGLSNILMSQGMPAFSVVKQCTTSLLRTLEAKATVNELEEQLLLATAAFLQFPTSIGSNELLQLICWAPLRRFDLPFMETGVFSWYWIIASSSYDTQYQMVTHIADAWLDSKRQKLGLFGSNYRKSETVNEIACHHRWGLFLLELWEVIQSDLSGVQTKIAKAVHGLLSTSLKGLTCVNAHPAATGAWFRFLTLSLQYCKSQASKTTTNSTSTCLLIEQTIRAAFEWFAASPRWFDGDEQFLWEALQAVSDFASLLHGTAWPKSPSDIIAKVWGIPTSIDEKAPRASLLQDLLISEVQRLSAWADPLGKNPIVVIPLGSSIADRNGDAYAKAAWKISPCLALALHSRFSTVSSIKRALKELILSNVDDNRLHMMPEAIPLLLEGCYTSKREGILSKLDLWSTASVPQAISLLTSKGGKHPLVRKYLTRSFQAADPDEVSFFLPQLVQALRFDEDKSIENILLEAASNSAHFAYLLVCHLRAEGTPPEDAFNPVVKRSNWSPPSDTGIWGVADATRKLVLESLSGTVSELLHAQLSYFDAVTDISGKLYPIAKEERRSAAVKFVEEISIPPRSDLFLPTNVEAIVVRALPQSTAPMQSAAKCPILVAFEVEEKTRNSEECSSHMKIQACIFKVGDDCRQDVLALQVIELITRQYIAAGLDLMVSPYGVVPTGHECGIIEVIPNAKSRAQLGEITDGGLLEVFQREYGVPGSRRFEAARRNFIKSSAGYAVISYILQAKDRHNGNIMFDKTGRIIHIDFGFILGISPGGNLGFESAAFKLSYEMAELLDPGNTKSSESFADFEELCIKGYLAARGAVDSIIAIVEMMIPSQLPCFSRGEPVEELKQRFQLGLNDQQAASFMRRLVRDAYDKWTTGFYDLIQYYQNAIPK
jgi:hypothetical protein